jgi:hypothetical protein
VSEFFLFQMPDVEHEATVTGGADTVGVPFSGDLAVIATSVARLLMRMYVLRAYLLANLLVLVALRMIMVLILRICLRKIFRLEGLTMVMHWKTIWCLAWKRWYPKMMI